METESKHKIRCENLWKVFGQDSHRFMANWDTYKQMNKVQRLKRTRCVVGTREATFNVERGEIYCLMGLSGSGKSTLLRCINRLFEPTAGKVFIDDIDVTALSSTDLRNLRCKMIGMVFQNFALLPHRRLIRNATLGLEIQGMNKTKREKRAREALALVGLEGWEKSYPHELSGGMQQRVGLARALATDPEILLMDEAFSALDPLIRRQMQDEFVKLIKKVNKTIVFVTHDLNEALRIAGHIAVMKDGAIVQQGTPSEIVLKPKTDYVAEFVKDLPKIKFITAADIMEPPDKWVVKPTASINQIIKTMNANQLRFVFVVDDNQRIANVIDYYQLTRNNHDYLDKPVGKQGLFCDYPIPRACQTTFLEQLIEEGAKSKVPTTIQDDIGRLVGIVSREKLLLAITMA